MALILRWLTDFLNIPTIRRSAWSIVEMNYLRFRHSFWTSLAGMLIEPVLTMVVLGIGLGAIVGKIGSLTYLEYLVPGMAAVATMMVSFSEVGFGTHNRLESRDPFFPILLTPTDPSDISLGEILWGALKGMAAGIGVLLVGLVLGCIHSAQALAAPIILLLSGLFFSSLGLLVSTVVRSPNGLVLMQALFLLPMALVCDTFFPLSDRHPMASYALRFLPLSHATLSLRGLVTGQMTSQLFLSLAVLILLTVVMLNAAIIRFSRRLVPV